jgi:hypothetical protein
MPATEEKIATYVQELVNVQQERVQRVLTQIPNKYRQLMAVHGFVRHAGRINPRWPMTDAEETTFRGSSAGQAMQHEIQAIQRAFASAHRGYSLRVNPRARSLDTQITAWNGSGRGGRIAENLGRDLWRRAGTELDSGTTYPEPPTATSKEAFRRWIAQHPRTGLNLRARVDRTTYHMPTLATPGLSDHGRLRAIDFEVRRGGDIIATSDSTTESRAIWRGVPNWQTRLNNVITGVSANWDGPLERPDEPWHYTYGG